MRSYVVNITGPGDPIHHGPPSIERIKQICSLTTAPDQGTGAQLYRATSFSNWRRLRGPLAFAELSEILGSKI